MFGKLLVGGLAIVLAVAAFLAIRAYADYHELAGERDEVLAENARLEAENRQLQAQIDALKKSDAAVEKVARERLGLIKEDEVIYELPD